MEPNRIGDSPDGRKEPRINVMWPGRLALPQGRVIEVRLRDVSVGGVGFTSQEIIPTLQPLVLSMDIPKPADMSQSYRVPVYVTAVYLVLQGSQYRAGATWQLEAAARELISVWIKRLEKK